MRLIPHGFTVLVEPDPQPKATDSGLILMPDERDYVPTSGVVVAVGKGSRRLWMERRKAYDRAMMAFGMREEEPGSDIARIFGRILAWANSPEPIPSVHVGDRVVFAPEAGLTVQDDGETYILLEEDRIAIVVNEEDEAVAV